MLNICAVVRLLSRNPCTADGTVRCCASKGTLTPELLDAMRQHKDVLHGLVKACEDRTAIAEYSGGVPRAEAERFAWAGIPRASDI